MDVFGIRNRLVDDYRSYTTSFVAPRDPRIADYLQRRLDDGAQWPDPWLSLNPFFASGGTITEAVDEGLLHPACARIFRIKPTITDHGERDITLHRHQRDAIQAAQSGDGYVLTTGTGSGKSLAYIVPIVDRVLRMRAENPGAAKSVKAIVVYPMNALANSQLGELRKFLTHGFGNGNEPVTFARYTGQESDTERERIMAAPPDILLTNYVMLELLLTRPRERQKLIRAAHGLQFLVLDELHTYRGRQGADVAMLVRRLREACNAPTMQCIGTSATMASGGSRADQRRQVAAVATRLFGADITAARVIGETLERATADQPADAAALRRAINTRPADTFADLVDDPLASWVETAFGLAKDPDTGDLVRRHPNRVDTAAAELADITGEPHALCQDAIKAMLQAGSRARHPTTDRPLFAFRIHQFISKGDNILVSLEAPADRHITTRYQVAVPNQPAKSLIPLVFCRECGQDYLAVVKDSSAGDIVYRPRQDRDGTGGTDAGYLYIADDFPWPSDPDDLFASNRLPDSWVTTGKSGEQVVVDTRRKRLPRNIRIMADGTQTHGDDSGLNPTDEPVTGDGVRATFVPSPFAFCLRCGTSYEQRGGEFARLASVSNEGRSSAVTVITTSVVRSLKAVADPDFDDRARKLLTFVDNRQDASLQAGHVNDFVQVSQLRSALARATAAAGPEGLASTDIGAAVVDALGLRFQDYSLDLDPAPRIRNQREEALRTLVSYRLFADLQRGWRINMPNLEQAGLLVIKYEDLDWLAAQQNRWEATHPVLRHADTGHRQELLTILLDEMRRALALESPLLTETDFEKMRADVANNLREPWSMDSDEPMITIKTVYPRSTSGGRGTPQWALNMSGRGAFGQFIRGRSYTHKPDRLTLDDTQTVIADLLTVACDGGLLRATDPDDGVPGYRLNIDALRWYTGSGQYGVDDRLRRNVRDEAGPRVNPFFRDLYQRDADRLTGLLAREHTAQVPSAIREEREGRFRDGTLPMLFCSPTMELGVDIASLNAVALRNVPPTPANYAQRSGRAGRSGEPALVVTYCDSGNSHDSYYFARSDQMVAGAVAAPRLDLGNEDLLRAHLHAVWLAETGADLGRSMTDLLEVEGDTPTLEIRDTFTAQFNEPGALARATARARDVISGLVAELQSTAWYDDTWVDRVVAQAPAAFDAACRRWRELYRGARDEQILQNKIVNDPSASRPARTSATARRREAEMQLRLLRNEDSNNAQTDFYPYRYFASEGFLPGYSFPRLPLAAFIPGSRRRIDAGDYLQRARFLAVSEFGPGSLIYHEGARFQVDRVQLPPGDPNQPGSIGTVPMRRCEACGYLHDRAALVDDCGHCGQRLGAVTEGLMPLRTVFTRRRERISSDEEERRRTGFELQFSYRFADRGSRPGHTRATVTGGDTALLTLTYGDAATIRVANLGLRRRTTGPDKADGFWVDTLTGRWLSDKAGSATVGTPMDELDDQGNITSKARVIPFVEDSRNILITRLADTSDDDVTMSLRYALERGIEAEFQLEDSELASQTLPDSGGHGRTLFMEANEGGAGVLRRIVDEPDAIARVARRALGICHFDPDTGADLLADKTADERCEKACYDCLLSYSNQLDHPLIDRHTIRDLLLTLTGASTSRDDNTPGSDHVNDLRARCDSTLETAFLDYLITHDHRLPTAAQEAVDDAMARPDFTYHADAGPVAVFLDGPVHDHPHQTQRDTQARTRLEDLGWFVVAIRHDSDWAATLADYPSVFGTGR